ncbi:PfkB family carbohydrate kinase, partial [Arthrobacter sp. M4]|uniref:PfkB family carbohydrate kinase n=1 Tax=Arthrobacter sp. M4 TaxID=218160 RepID=UPI001CDB4D47
EALTDIIHTSAGTREHPGGSPANVALGLARLGVATSFLTALGRDPRGQAIASRLEAAGVTLLPESWSHPATSTAVAEIQDDGAARYTFDLTWSLPKGVNLPAADHVHIGSVAAFLTPGADQVEEIVRGLRGTATVSFDPNIRPDLVGQPSTARARFERLAALADVVKLSDEDAAFLYPNLTPGEAARSIAAHGPVVAVTAGANGSLLLAGGDLIDIQPVRTTVADTVGAGDGYMSALLWALLASRRPQLEPLGNTKLAAAGAFAAKAAAITVSRPGAEPPTLAELSSPNPAL